MTHLHLNSQFFCSNITFLVDACQDEVSALLFCSRQKIHSKLSLPNHEMSVCYHFTLRFKAKHFESNWSSLIRFKYFICQAIESCILLTCFFPFQVWHTQINTLCKLCGRKMHLSLCYLRRLSAIFTLCKFCKKSPTFIQRAYNEE